MSTSLNSNLETLFSKMENFITSKTVVGDPIYMEGIIVIPLVDVSFVIGAGASAGTKKDKDTEGEAGGGGIGSKITPSAVIVIMNGTAQLISVKKQDSVNKLIDMVPGIVSKLNLDSVFSKAKDNKDAGKTQE